MGVLKLLQRRQCYGTRLKLAKQQYVGAGVYGFSRLMRESYPVSSSNQSALVSMM